MRAAAPKVGAFVGCDVDTKAEAKRLQLNLADEVFIMIAVDEKGNVHADLIGSEKYAIKKYGRERVLGRA
jgi:hypothetical protein